MNLLYPLKALLGMRTVVLIMERPNLAPMRMTLPEKYLGKLIDTAVEKGFSVRIERMT